jgi:hypothetical protein
MRGIVKIDEGTFLLEPGRGGTDADASEMSALCARCGHARVFHQIGTGSGVQVGQAFCDDRHSDPCNCTGFVTWSASCVHVIPRAEVRYVEVIKLAGYSDGWSLNYQLTGMPNARTIQWKGDCRPPTLKSDAKITIGEYNRIAAESVQATITRGQRDVHLERRSDGVILVRSGLIEDDTLVVLCRKFITEMALTARQTAIGPLDDTRLHMLHEIHAAARDLVLPDWFPLREDSSTSVPTTKTT